MHRCLANKCKTFQIENLGCYNVNATILEECQLCLHVDRVKNMFCDIYIVEFSYDPTCNYYERGKYDCRNFHVTKLPLFRLRLLLFLSSLHMLVFACLGNLFANKIPMHRKYVRLILIFTCYMMPSSCFNCYLLWEHH